jgi:O-antigen ligase
VLVLALPFFVLGGGGVKAALSENTATWLNPFDEEFRFMGREASWDIFGDFPMFGTGYGTYASVYPGYKVRGPMLYFAHCDLLQWMSETGLVGLALAVAILATLFWTAVTGWFRLKDSFAQRLLLGCTLACAAFLLHGLVDFPLAIPGVVIVFVALAALAVVLSKDRIAREEESDFIF